MIGDENCSVRPVDGRCDVGCPVDAVWPAVILDMPIHSRQDGTVLVKQFDQSQGWRLRMSPEFFLYDRPINAIREPLRARFSPFRIAMSRCTT